MATAPNPTDGGAVETATLDLICSICSGSDRSINDSESSSSHLFQLAGRIMQSSIGTTKRNLCSSSVLKRIEKTITGQQTAAKMPKIKALYETLNLMEGQELGSNVLLLLGRLAGSKSKSLGFSPGLKVGMETSKNTVTDPHFGAKQNDSMEDEPLISTRREQGSEKNCARSSEKSSGSIHNEKYIKQALHHEEMTLLRECIYALQNINGESICFLPSMPYTPHNSIDSNSMEYYSGIRVRPNLLPFHLSVSDRINTSSTRLFGSGAMDALRICGEAGWLYSRIQFYIDTATTTRVDFNGGVVARALASALSHQLQDYLVFLSGLENQFHAIVRPYSTPASNTSSPEALKAEEDKNLPRLTLRRLLLQLRAGQLTKLHTLALLTDGIINFSNISSPALDALADSKNTTEMATLALSGGQLITALYIHSRHGDPRHSQLVHEVLEATTAPWFDMLFAWTMTGKLLLSSHSLSSSSFLQKSIDKAKESDFFINYDANVPDAHMWHNRYTLMEPQVPRGIISIEVAKEALVVGKGINFVRKCLEDSTWSLEVDVEDVDEGSKRRAGGPRKRVDIEEGNLKEETKKRLGFCYQNLQKKILCDVQPLLPSSLLFASWSCPSTISELSPLQKTIRDAARQVHNHILKSLFEKHFLLQHLHALKQFLLLGQGDFISALMDGLHAEFDCGDGGGRDKSGTNGIYMHSMMGVLHDALRNTNARFLPSFVLERVHVKLLPAKEAERGLWQQKQYHFQKGLGNTGLNESGYSHDNDDYDPDGWDVFSLDYAIDAPLTAVVHPEAVEKYHQVFALLFRLKRIDWMLNNTWRQSTALNHAMQLMINRFGSATGVITASGHRSNSAEHEGALARMNMLLRRESMTRQSMLHFVSNLQSYLMFEVLEGGWKDLVTKLKTSKTLDEVIHAHNEYLDEIVAKSLLSDVVNVSGNGGTIGEEGEEENAFTIGRQLRRVLTISYRFCKFHDRVFNDALRSIDRAADKRRRGEHRIQSGKWGFDSLDEEVGSANFYNLSEADRLQEMESIAEEFDVAIRDVINMLNNKLNDGSRFDNPSGGGSVGSTPSRMTPPFLNRSFNDTDGLKKAAMLDNDSLRFLTFRLDFSEYYGSWSTTKSLGLRGGS